MRTNYDKQEILIQSSKFDGYLEFPIVEKCMLSEKSLDNYKIISYYKNKNKESKILYLDKHKKTVNQYEKFVIKHLNELKGFKAIITPDYSQNPEEDQILRLYDIYRSRSIASFLSNNQINVIPSIGWSKDIGFDNSFLGLLQEGIFCISPDMPMRTDEEKQVFIEGLEFLINYKIPKAIIVDESIDRELLKSFRDTRFIYKNLNFEKGATNGNK